MRYQFLPYLYTLFHEHEKTGEPVMRPLWYEYPSDQDSYLNDDEYLVGKDLLVAPVIREGQRKRNVYFPKGDDWLDWQTGMIYKGGSNVEVLAPKSLLTKSKRRKFFKMTATATVINQTVGATSKLNTVKAFCESRAAAISKVKK